MTSLSVSDLAHFLGITPLLIAIRIGYLGIIPGSLKVVSKENTIVKINMHAVNENKITDILIMYGAINKKYIVWVTQKVIKYQ